MPFRTIGDEASKTPIGDRQNGTTPALDVAELVQPMHSADRDRCKAMLKAMATTAPQLFTEYERREAEASTLLGGRLRRLRLWRSVVSGGLIVAVLSLAWLLHSGKSARSAVLIFVAALCAVPAWLRARRKADDTRKQVGVLSHVRRACLWTQAANGANRGRAARERRCTGRRAQGRTLREGSRSARTQLAVRHACNSSDSMG